MLRNGGKKAGLGGVYVSSVVKGGPADRAGMQKDDLILDYRGRHAGSAGELRNDIASTPAGERAALTLMRNGKRIRVSVTVENLGQASPFLLKEAESRLGARIWSITWDKAAQERIGQGYGVVLEAVNPKGPLGRAGLQAGDTIVETDGHKIEDFDDFLEFVDSLDARQTAALLIKNHAGKEIGPVLLKIE
jgi:serine protease Do